MTPEQRSAYRRFVLAHHPDRGGDSVVFIAGLTAMRSRPAAMGGPVIGYRRRRGLAALLGPYLAHRAARRRAPRVR